MNKFNAGYELIEELSFSQKHYVLGHNPAAPAAYVTWEANESKDAFFRGHYFTEKEPAMLDLFQRAGKNLHLEGGKSLGMALLTELDRHDLRQEFRDENAREDIAAALAEELVYTNVQYDQDALLNDPQFMTKAIRAYDKLDHSYENEALRDELSDILMEFPQHRIFEEELHGEIQIPPELNDLIKDIRSMPTAAVAEKYGPLGDNIAFDFTFDDGRKATLSLVPEYEFAEPDKLSVDEPHRFYLEVFNEDGSSICDEPLYGPFLNGNLQFPDAEKGAAGKFEIPVENLRITLEVQEDEKLRRIGNQFLYQSNTESEPYHQHDGEICTIQRGLTPKECDILCSGLMWEAKFPDGDVLHVFDSELQLPQKEQSRRTPLSQKITSAQEKAATTSPISQRNKPER